MSVDILIIVSTFGNRTKSVFFSLTGDDLISRYFMSIYSYIKQFLLAVRSRFHVLRQLFTQNQCDCIIR